MTSLRLGASKGSIGMKCVYGGLWVIFLLSTVFSSLSNAGLLESCPYEYGSRAFIDTKLCHYNPNPAPVGDLGNVSPDVQIPGGELTYYHNDVLGSPIAASDQYGGLLWKEEYKPFGEKVIGLDAPSTVGYTGHQFDEGTGLTYMQARYYDPVVGRFYGVDPVGFVESNPMSFNRYLYVNDNPYKYVDPNGEFLVSGALLLYAGASLAWSAYDAYNTASDVYNGNITVGEAATNIAIDAAVGALGGAAAKGGLKLLRKSGALAKATKGATDAAKRLGVNLDKISVTNGVGRAKIDLSANLDPGDINKLKDVFKARGANKAEIDTGFIANEKLDAFLRRRVQDGKSFNGGTVRNSTSKGSDFTIDFDL